MKNPQVGDRVIYRGDLELYNGEKGTIKGIYTYSRNVIVNFDIWPSLNLPISRYSCVRLKKKRKAPENYKRLEQLEQKISELEYRINNQPICVHRG